MKIAIVLLGLACLAGCGSRADERMRQEMTELLEATTALVRQATREDRAGLPVIERVETDADTIVFALWPGSAYEVFKVGRDGRVITIAYRNAGGSLQRFENAVRETTVR